jgi:hypothetical protein
MTNYQVHPDSLYGVELRDGLSVDDYIAKARGFHSTAQLIEYRDASPKRRKEMRRERDNNADDGDEDRRRTLDFLRLNK